MNYTIWSSVELSRPAVVQHHGHLTLTLDFQGQILKMLYLRNGRANWHWTKGMRVDRTLDPHCDFELWRHPWPWPLIFKVEFWKSCNSGRGCPIDMEWKGCESTECSTLTSPMTLTWIFKSDFEIAVSQEWEGQLTWNTYFVTLSFDLDLGFSRSNFENAVSQEWDASIGC